MNLDFCWAVLTLLYSSAQPSLVQFSRRATLAFFFHTKHCWHTKSFWSNPLLLYFSWQIALHASPPSHFMLFGARNPYVFLYCQQNSSSFDCSVQIQSVRIFVILFHNSGQMAVHVCIMGGFVVHFKTLLQSKVKLGLKHNNI